MRVMDSTPKLYCEWRKKFYDCPDSCCQEDECCNYPLSGPMGHEGPPSLRSIPDDQIHHVYPTFGREHVTNQRNKCWCKPRVEYVEGGAIIIHEAEQ